MLRILIGLGIFGLVVLLASAVYAAGQVESDAPRVVAMSVALQSTGDPVADAGTSALKGLADLGIPVVTSLAIVWAYIMWRTNAKTTDRYITYLEGQITLWRRSAGFPIDSSDPVVPVARTSAGGG